MREPSLTLARFFAVLLLTITCVAVGSSVAQKASGSVYVMSNNADANSVLVFQRSSNGSIQQIQEALTQGLGTGASRDPLMSQGAVTLSTNKALLFAVNPGSGELTGFRVTSTGTLEFGSKVLSGGLFPVSVTEHGGVVYVLNQLGIPNVTGFTVDEAGRLQMITNSTRELAGGGLALPAEVSFTPDGKKLLVTEKGTAQLDIFDVQSDGRLSEPTVQPSPGKVPFGFDFGPFGTVVVSETQGGLTEKASASSYLLSGNARVVSSAVPNKQTASCWVAITCQTAWVVNTVSATISAYQINSGGQLQLVNRAAANTGVGTTPIDLDATTDGAFLYVVESAVGGIAGYRVNGSTLTPLFNRTGLPLTIQGIAVR